MIAALLILALAAAHPSERAGGDEVAAATRTPPAHGAILPPPADVCDSPPGGWTVEARAETRRRVRAECERQGASRDACAALDAVTVRESSGRATATHTLGPGEDGLGAHGLSRAFARLLGQGTDPAWLCVPEVSATVVLLVWRRAVQRYHARTWIDVGRVYGGRFGELGRPVSHDRDAAWCRRLRTWGVGCHDDPSGQLGESEKT